MGHLLLPDAREALAFRLGLPHLALQLRNGGAHRLLPLSQLLQPAFGIALFLLQAGGGFRKLIQIVFGLSIAFAASSFFLSFFSFGGGTLI